MECYKVPASRGVRGRGCFSQSAGRGRASSNYFLGQGRGHALPQRIPRTSATGNRQPRPSRITSWGKSDNSCYYYCKSNSSKAGGLQDCLHVWKTIKPLARVFLKGCLNFRVWGQFEIKILTVRGYSDINTTYFIWIIGKIDLSLRSFQLVICQRTILKK